jgi:hypothetical protein
MVSVPVVLMTEPGRTFTDPKATVVIAAVQDIAARAGVPKLTASHIRISTTRLRFAIDQSRA